MTKTIWIFNHHACTPQTGPLLRHYFFGKELKKNGYNVVVFAANEIHFNDNSIDTNGKKYIEKTDEDTPFVFVKTTKYNKGNGLNRIKNMFSFFLNLFSATKKYSEIHEKPDVIIGSSVHPLSCVAGIKIARRYQIPCICEIRDLWPEALFFAKMVKEKSLLGKILVAGEHWIYRNADALIFTKEGDVDYIKEHEWTTEQGGDIELKKCWYINNGVELSSYYRQIETEQMDDADLTGDKFLVIYSGTIRKVNNVGNILDAAHILKDCADIKFLIYGEGNEAETLQKRINDERLTNVKMKGFVEKKHIPFILSRSSVNLLNYSQSDYNWARGNSSNKLFEYMASGKPVISTVKMGYSIIEKYKCGIELDEHTPQALAAAIKQIKCMPREQYDTLCENAKNGARDFDYRQLSEKLKNVIEQAISVKEHQHVVR